MDWGFFVFGYTLKILCKIFIKGLIHYPKDDQKALDYAIAALPIDKSSLIFSCRIVYLWLNHKLN